MKKIKIDIGPFQKTEQETKLFTEDEYFLLSELFRKFKVDGDDDIFEQIGLFISRVPEDSSWKIAFYFNNWSKTKTITNDYYLSLVNTLGSMCESAYQKKPLYFLM